MVTVYDVPPNKLIESVSEELKEMEEIQEPEWAMFVKTGVHKEKAPEQPDWWYKRVSAIFRSVYVEGPIGISRLKGKYGGKYRRGSKPNHVEKGSGSIIRKGLQQLESSGMIEKEDDGRKITPEGQSFLNDKAHEIIEEMAKENPELSKYL
ncbi:MAG: 30S ribosomal protein S19e [Candidatus Thermoplasmatota archaeon]|nr:30S ribosomal protein S19e [Candidatus Thermoplasmatota archaeon]